MNLYPPVHHVHCFHATEWPLFGIRNARYLYQSWGTPIVGSMGRHTDRGISYNRVTPFLLLTSSGRRSATRYCVTTHIPSGPICNDCTAPKLLCPLEWRQKWRNIKSGSGSIMKFILWASNVDLKCVTSSCFCSSTTIVRIELHNWKITPAVI